MNPGSRVFVLPTSTITTRSSITLATRTSTSPKLTTSLVVARMKAQHLKSNHNWIWSNICSGNKFFYISTCPNSFSSLVPKYGHLWMKGITSASLAVRLTILKKMAFCHMSIAKTRRKLSTRSNLFTRARRSMTTCPSSHSTTDDKKD